MSIAMLELGMDRPLQRVHFETVSPVWYWKRSTV